MRPRRRRGELVDGVYRSQFEAGVARDLQKRGVAFEYETSTFAITVPASAGHKCASDMTHVIVRKTRYTPDFEIVVGAGWMFVETKGKFTGRDRKVAVAFKTQYPKWDYRLLFQRDNTLSKASKTRYTEWCEKHGIKCAVGPRIPDEWTASAAPTPSICSTDSQTTSATTTNARGRKTKTRKAA
jgi:hypothetical protein